MDLSPSEYKTYILHVTNMNKRYYHSGYEEFKLQLLAKSDLEAIFLSNNEMKHGYRFDDITLNGKSIFE